MRFLLSTGAIYHLPLRHVFEIAVDCGFDGIELISGRDFETSDSSTIKKLISEFCLPVEVLHVPFLSFNFEGWSQTPQGKLEQSLELAKQLGSRVVVQHVPISNLSGFKNWFKSNIIALQSQPGPLICVENMPERFVFISLGLARIIRNWAGEQQWIRDFVFKNKVEIPKMLSPFFFPLREGELNHIDYLATLRYLTLDVTHLATAGLCVPSMIKKVAKSIQHVHLSDYLAEDHLMPWEGSLDIDEIMAALVAVNYQESITLEVKPEVFDFSTNRQTIINRLRPVLHRLRQCVSEG
jgi:sugar phosphate isomerase/epimerase